MAEGRGFSDSESDCTRFQLSRLFSVFPGNLSFLSFPRRKWLQTGQLDGAGAAHY